MRGTVLFSRGGGIGIRDGFWERNFDRFKCSIFDWPGLDNSFKNSFSLVVSQKRKYKFLHCGTIYSNLNSVNNTSQICTPKLRKLTG